MRRLLFAAPALLCGCFGPADTLIRPETTNAVCDGRAPSTLRIVTYNIKAALESSLDAIGDVLADLAPDVVALQEVDRDVPRSGNLDQAAELAERLDMTPSYAAARTRDGGDYGVAILSRLPFAGVERFSLPGTGSFEPRVALRADLCAGSDTIHVFATHSDLNPFARVEQQRALAEIARPLVGEGVIVAGDMNDTADAIGLRALGDVPLVDVGAIADDEATCNGRRIDFVMTDDRLARGDLRMRVTQTDASDHFPVLAELSP